MKSSQERKVSAKNELEFEEEPQRVNNNSLWCKPTYIVSNDYNDG